MTGRGKGDRQLYQARMLRGSVGDTYGIYWGQLVGRKRIGVFSKRLTGRISLPKPGNAFIAQPPSYPIGWNTEVLGDWKKAEPFAAYAGRWEKSYGEKNLKAIDRKKDLGQKHYDKYGSHEQIIDNKWQRIPKDVEAKIANSNNNKRPSNFKSVQDFGKDVRNIVNPASTTKKK